MLTGCVTKPRFPYSHLWSRYKHSGYLRMLIIMHQTQCLLACNILPPLLLLLPAVTAITTVTANTYHYCSSHPGPLLLLLLLLLLLPTVTGVITTVSTTTTPFLYFHYKISVCWVIFVRNHARPGLKLAKVPGIQTLKMSKLALAEKQLLTGGSSNGK